MNCPIFNKFSICPDGVSCKKNHSYNDETVQINFSLNLIVSSLQNIISKIDSIKKDVDTLKNEVDLIKHKQNLETNPNIGPVILNHIKSINKRLESIENSNLSKGLPLKAYYTEFTDVSKSVNLPNKQEKTRPSIDVRAVEISREEQYCIPTENNAGEVSSQSTGSKEEDIKNGAYAFSLDCTASVLPTGKDPGSRSSSYSDLANKKQQNKQKDEIVNELSGESNQQFVVMSEFTPEPILEESLSNMDLTHDNENKEDQENRSKRGTSPSDSNSNHAEQQESDSEGKERSRSRVKKFIGRFSRSISREKKSDVEEGN